MYQRILVPVDGSTTSNRGLDEAIRLAGLTGASLRLIHVVDELSIAIASDSYGSYVKEMFQQLELAGKKLLDACESKARAAGLPVDSVLFDNLAGPVHDLVLNEATTWHADLIVLGTHGRRGVKRLVLGSSAEKILRVSPVPVLLVRAPESASTSARDARESDKEPVADVREPRICALAPLI